MSEQQDNVYKKLQRIRVELYKKDLKKTGENDFKGFKYYELNDFLPQCNELMLQEGLVSIFNMYADKAELTFINCDNTDDKIEFCLPLPDRQLEIKGANSIQNIGGTSTYIRRYLYLIAFEIAENDAFDADVKPPSKDKEMPNEKNSAQAAPLMTKTSGITQATTMTAEKAGTVKIFFGEHKGKTLKEIYKNEKEYFNKLLEDENFGNSYIKEACRVMDNAVKEQAQKNNAKEDK